MNKTKIYLITGTVERKHRTALATDIETKVGDIVKYRAMGEDLLCEVESVFQTTVGSDIHDWVCAAAKNISEREVLGVFRQEPVEAP